MTKPWRMAASAACFSLAPLLAVAETYSVEGAAPQSLTGIIPQMMAQYAAKDGVEVQAVLGQTATRSALKVATGKLDMGVVPPAAILDMRSGSGSFAELGEKAKPLADNMSFLFSMPGGTFHTIVWDDSGITSFKDLAGKRVFIGPPGGAANAMITSTIDVASGGLKEGKDYTGVKAPWPAGQQAFQDGQFDAYLAAVVVGQKSLTELSMQRPIRILGVPAEVVESDDWKKMLKAQGLETAVIPAGTYQGQANGDQDLFTPVTVMLMTARKDLPEDVAYKITKSYWENIDAMKEANALMKAVDKTKPFSSAVVPLHPGAVRYYQEAGIEIPAELMPK